MKLALIILLLPFALFADPWGKDADLVQSTPSCETESHCQTPLFGVIGESVIWFHQNIVSPADGPRSNFYPTSSHYMKHAIRKHGFFLGFVMGCDRLMRENTDPWIYDTIIDSRRNRVKLNPVR